MLTLSGSKVVNRLIASLSGKQREIFLKQCETTNLHFGDQLCEAGQQYDHVYFPITGFISLTESVSDHPPLEIALIGNEGMLGASLTLGVNTVPLSAIVQGTGIAQRMHPEHFKQHLQNIPSLAEMLKRYLYVQASQLAQTTACTRFHTVEARLARWLLMTHDRAHADHFSLTHEFLAAMLGVRRSGITIAAGALQQRQLISYTRGEIQILDRLLLEEASCECYAAITEDYNALLG